MICFPQHNENISDYCNDLLFYMVEVFYNAVEKKKKWVIVRVRKYADGHWKNSAGVLVGPRAKSNIWGPT